MRVIKKEILWFIIASIGAFYWGLSSYALLNNNEGLYAEIAWEMLSNRDFIIPTLNGVPYIEKPPMLYWLISLSYAIFGKSVWAARLVPASFGFLTCLSLMFFYRALGRERQGIAAGTLLASSLGFAIFSRMVFFDGLLTAFFTFALLCFYLWDQRGERKWLRLFYVFLACALLTKGLLSLCLAGLIGGTFLLAKYRSFSKIWAVWDTMGVLLFLLIAMPWHVFAHLQQPDFSWFYFINEHVMRFLDKREPRDYYHGPFYYYLLRIPAYFMPWTLLLPFVGKASPSLVSPVEAGAQGCHYRAGTSWSRLGDLICSPGSMLSRGRQMEGVSLTKTMASNVSPKQHPRLFLWLWAGLTLLFFSLSQAKANYYMMLGMPPLALLMVEYWGNRPRFAVLSKIAVLLSFGLIIAATIVVPSRNTEISAIEGAAFLKKQPIQEIYLYKRFEHLASIIFYYGKPLPLVDSESADLAFGEKTPQAAGRFFAFDNVVADPAPKLFVVHQRDVTEFENRCGGICGKIYGDKELSVYLLPVVTPAGLGGDKSVL
jgi:4-amino-4-deoxy-L-arabinose transferase-like glycosyltransferase